MVKAKTGLISALTMNRVRQIATTSSTNISNEENKLLENQNGSNVHLKTQQENENGFSVHLRIQPENENCSNVDLRTQPHAEDEIFLNISNIWFANNAYDPQDHQRVNVDSNNSNPKIINQIF